MAAVVVIPAYNAARHLPDVLARVEAAALPELARVVVVDDGSTDGTAACVAAGPAGRTPVELLSRPRNGGYGAAMKDGLARARELGAEVVACVHADGQYSPEALPRLVAALGARGLDLLQGSRVASGTALSGGMPLYKYVANAVLNRLENRTLGLSMTDYHSGYLVYGRRALELPTAGLSDSFDFDLELIATARAHGLRVAEEPVPTHYGDEESHLNPITYGLRVLRVMWNFRRGLYSRGDRPAPSTSSPVGGLNTAPLRPPSPPPVAAAKPRRPADPGAATGVLVAFASLAALAACHPGLAPAPWAGAGARVPAAHADVRTLNEGYSRERSGVLVRQIDRPTRASLDWAAYHANFMIADPPPEGARPRFKPDTSHPFEGLVEAATLTGDVGKTPLTDAERARPLAFAPAIEYLAAHKVPGADALGDVAAAVRGEGWGGPGPPGVPAQTPTDLYVHEAGGGPELWVKIELAPWFAAATFKGAPDQDGDGVPEVYGRVKAGLVAPDAAAALRGEYSTHVLTPAEAKAWANQLSSYWYPSYNTDLVPPGPAWPDAHTEADIKQELGGRSFQGPTFVLRGKPAGKPVYEVFLVGGGAAAPAATAAPSLLKLAPTKPSPDPRVVATAVAGELAAHGGRWEAWQAEVAPLHEALRKRLGAMPAGSKALAGSDGFLFFKNGLDYVVGGDLGKQPAGKNPLPIIVEFQKMLAAHGVDFLFVPVPTKEEIFPDKLDPAGRARVGQVVNPFSRKLLADLAAQGVESVDLLPELLAARARDKRGEEPLYQRQDTHWTDRGLRLAAELVAKRIKAYPWYAELATHARKFRTRPAAFTRFGDLHSRLPEAEKARYKPESLHAQQVLADGGQPYDDDADSPIVVLGDSFTGVYELTESEHAGVSAHVARDVAFPVDLVMSYGGGPNVRQKLMRRGVEGLQGKKLVVWMMTARDLYNYWEDWTPLKVK